MEYEWCPISPRHPEARRRPLGLVALPARKPEGQSHVRKGHIPEAGANRAYDECNKTTGIG
eukprot:1194991-Prorocentrum_minimum.AAC.3